MLRTMGERVMLTVRANEDCTISVGGWAVHYGRKRL